MTEYSDQVDKETKALMAKTEGQDKSVMESAMAACHVAEYYEKVKSGNSEAR